MNFRTFIVSFLFTIILCSGEINAQELSDFIPNEAYLTIKKASVFTGSDKNLKLDTTQYAIIEIGPEMLNIEVFNKKSKQKSWSVFYTGVKFELLSFRSDSQENMYLYELVTPNIGTTNVIVGVATKQSKESSIGKIHISVNDSRTKSYRFFWDPISSKFLF